MRIGDVVTVADGRGGLVESTVIAVGPAGASGYKTLDFAEAAGVPHVRDAEDGGAYWRFRDEADRPAAPAPIAWREAEWDEHVTPDVEA